MPVAYSIAWEAPWDFGWVMVAETLLSFGSSSVVARSVEEVEIARLEDVSTFNLKRRVGWRVRT
jgi:hypothetical protein